MDIVDPRIERYLVDVLGGDHPVAEAMEALAEERDFPIVDRAVGVTLEVLARAVGARRVFELGSGFGYSAYWFARAVGDGGEVHMTDSDQANQDRALEFLGKAGLGGRARPHVGEALHILDDTPGEFDIVFCDVHKDQYPAAWDRAKERIRVGGLYLCDNVLWSGHVTGEAGDDPNPDWTRAVKEHNTAIAGDERYRATIVPTRDGVMVAVRVV